MELTSRAFTNEGRIPKKYTCEGDDSSLPLQWSGAPDGTKSFALIVDDPDAPDPAAPKRVWVHLVLYDIPATVNELAEGAAHASSVSAAHDALNDDQSLGWSGPCPPIGRHRYFHKLYALDALLGDLGRGARKADVERAMAGHVLATAELMGTYSR